MNFNERAIEYFSMLENRKEEALDYYFTHLFDEIATRFTHKVNQGIEAGTFKPYRYLIMTVGFSPEPLTMWIRAFKPKKVYFLFSSNTEKFIDDIAKHTGLRHSQVKHERVSSSNTIDVYEKIKKFIEEDKLDLNEIAIDISGGKKSMVSGCTLAANYLGLDVLYVDNTDYNQSLRKPPPGTEIPVKLEDPLEVFGDRELQKGITKFNSEDFASAIEIFSGIKERVAEPRYYEMFERLAQGYKDLENMNFKQSYSHIEKAIEYAELIRNESLPIEALKTQLKAIEALVDFPHDEPKKVFNSVQRFWHIYGLFMSLASQYIEQDKADLAALLTYRSLEMAVQYSLYKHGIQVGEASLKHLDEEDLLAKVNTIGVTLYGPKFLPYVGFPNKLGLMLGLMILAALEDPLIKKIDLQNILKNTDARNKSRYAHGFKTLTIDDIHPFFQIVIGNVSEILWKKEKQALGFTGKKTSFRQFLTVFKFVKL